MYGTAINRLEVYVKETGDVTNGTLVWVQNTGLGNFWYPAKIDIITNQDFQV